MPRPFSKLTAFLDSKIYFTMTFSDFKKLLHGTMATGAVCAATMIPVSAYATGWPANHEGVMLQGFWWDSYNEGTSWKNLEAKADEYSKYFNLIWVPNSAKSTGGNGYMPIYWFTNHNTVFGTEKQLRSMIATYKEKGVGIIEDVVINHRCGVSNWTNFPAEKWNGQTWQIGPEGICSTDEVRNEQGQAKPTGAPDTGEDFNGARDLDHTNANVQNNCKNYCKFLIDDMGYAGFRLDMVKGYGGQYTKIYNQYAKPKYSVGEYWDGSYDALAAWIEATGKESAAFDFAFKYQVNKCFNGGNHNYTDLVWKANGTTDQPAGLIHYGYQQYAVTFVDNHDTYRDGSKMTGDVLQANAFLLSSPGTPCVFLPHYNQYTKQIQAMIDARNGVGITNTSAVKVLKVDGSCYVAEITGKRGHLWVKLGNSSLTAGAGFTKKASGNGYEIWTTSEGGQNPDPDPQPVDGDYYLIGHLASGSWSTSASPAFAKEGNVYSTTQKIVAGDEGDYGYFSIITHLAPSWDGDNSAPGVNSFDRYGATSKDAAVTLNAPMSVQKFTANVDASSANSWKINPGEYKFTFDPSKMTMTVSTPTGIAVLNPEDGSNADSALVKWYNLQGQPVAEPCRGEIYIRVEGSKAQKLIY